MKKHIYSIFLLVFLSLLGLFSCSDYFISERAEAVSDGKVTFKGELSLDGALPSEIADALNNKETAAGRSAVPSVPSGVTFYAKASASGEEDKVISNDDFDKTGTNKITFNLPLEPEIKWTIETGIKSGDIILLKDSFTVTLNANQPVFSHIFILKPETESTGVINLSYNVCEGVKKLKIASDNNNWPNDLKEISFNGYTSYTLGPINVPSGIYSTVFYFYGENDILLYSTTQNITVFSGMTTDTWVSDGSGVIDGGKFELSQDLITQFTRTTFYVGSTGVGTASDETGSGSVYSPLESVTKAASIIAAAGDISKDYRIYVCGTVKGAQEISSAVNGKANSITIQGYNGLDENLEPKDALDGNNSGSTLTHSSSVPVTIKNLKITGGSGTSVNGTLCGGGIYTGDTASLYLESGALVTGNTANNGGGIYSKGKLYLSAAVISKNTAEEYGGGVYSTGSVFMYGSAVIGDKSKTSAATESDYSNKAGSKGAGIYSTGNLYLGYSSDNKTESLTGGVFYNFAKDTGGIHQLADEDTSRLFKMDSGYVSYNAGRGIYVGRCTLTMSGGSVSGNTAIKGSDQDIEYQLNGAGLYAGTEASCTVSGGTITENHAEGNGGGLYTAQNDSKIILEGGTISSNKANGNGMGIAVGNGYLQMKGSACVDSNNDVYLANGKVITVIGSLTGTAPVATITPATWTRGTTVVQVEGTNDTDLTPYKDFFTFTQDGWEAMVSTNKKSLIIDAPIYVAGTGRSVCTEDGDDEEGNGTKSKPFETIEKAIEVMDDNTADYIIYIDGTIVGYNIILNTLTTESSGNYRAHSITIEGVNGLDEKGEPKDVLDANKQQKTTLTVNSNVPVTIKNLKLTGSRGIENGGGINIGESATLFLGDGVLVTGNSASYGGGVYNAGKLFMYGSAMVGKTTNSVAKNDSYGNMTTGRGGGICLAAGSSLYLGYKSETEESELTGGVCGNYNNNSMYNYGGGIYNYGASNFKIASGNISYNCATTGAGIYTEGDVIMTGGVIEGNEAKGYGNGGGVYVTTESSFSMSGSAKIQNNKNVEKGAGLFLYEKCSLIMTGGTISGNQAIKSGGAVYMGESSNIKIAGDAAISYGGAGETKNNDIFMSGSDEKILLTAPLSDRGEDNVICIELNTYTYGRLLLEAGTGVTLADEVGKFTIPNNDWEINSSGKLITLSYTPSSVSDLVTCLQELPAEKNVTITINQSETIDTSSMSSGQSCITIPAGKYVTLQSDESKTLEFSSSNSTQLSNTTDFYFIRVKSGAKLTIGNGIKIKGADYDNAHTVALYIESGAEVILDGAVITDFIGNGDGTVYIAGGTFTMNKGSITSCKARYGSAVYLSSNGTFNFNGGSISSCSNVNGKTVDGSGTMNWKTSSATFSPESIGGSVTVNRQ